MLQTNCIGQATCRHTGTLLLSCVISVSFHPGRTALRPLPPILSSLCLEIREVFNDLFLETFRLDLSSLEALLLLILFVFFLERWLFGSTIESLFAFF